MGAGRTGTSRKVSEPVELARIEALVERARRVPGAYLGVSRVAQDRRQRKLCTFDDRDGDRIVVDLDRLRREHAGALVRFQLREKGQVLGTAQWHIPERIGSDGGAEERTDEPSVAVTRTTGSTEVLRAREEAAGARAEIRHLAEEVRRLRSELTAEQAARHRAEAERDLAIEKIDHLRAGREELRDKLRKAAVEKKESEIAFRLLLDRVPEDVEDVYRLVRGERSRRRG